MCLYIIKCLHQFTVDGENVPWNWEIDFQINLQVSLYIKLCVLQNKRKSILICYYLSQYHDDECKVMHKLIMDYTGPTYKMLYQNKKKIYKMKYLFA